MALCKAAGVIHTRTLLRAKGDKAEQAFLAQLDQVEKDYYINAMPVSMLPLETAMRIYSLAVPLIYTGCVLEDGLNMLAYDTARDNFRGIYRILVRLTSVETVLKQTAKIWKAYHTKGSASVERLGPNRMQLIISGYPDTPPGFEHIMDGFIKGTASLTNAKNMNVIHDLSDRDILKWTITWE